MLDRIRICLCHPKLIGSFYKDKVIKIIGMVLFFFFIYVGILAVRTFSTDHFTMDDNKYITRLVIAGDEKLTSYDSQSKTMSGAAKYVSDAYVVHFCPTDDVKIEMQSKITVLFLENKALVYFSTLMIGSMNYSDMKNVESFNLKDIRNGSIKNQMAFEEMLTQALDSANMNYASIYTLNNAINTIVFFVILCFTLCILSSFVNPTINRPIRYKLVVYSSLNFFLFMILSVLFGFEWISYIGFIVPAIYMFICLSHIIRVNKQV